MIGKEAALLLDAGLGDGNIKAGVSVPDFLNLYKEGKPMKITRKLNGTILEIAVEGMLDTSSSPELATDLAKGLDVAETLIWDFSNLDYISSAGFRVLLTAQNMLDDPNRMKVAHANEMVRTAFILTGQGDLLIDD